MVYRTYTVGSRSDGTSAAGRLNVRRAVTNVIESFRSIRVDATPTELWAVACCSQSVRTKRRRVV